jgi:exonuclease VII small subunit
MTAADDQDSREPVPVSELSYTDASRELDAIVSFFEQREVDVDLLVAQLERATAIVDELDRRIRRTRAQVDELVPKLEAATRPGVPTSAHADDGTGDGDERDAAGPVGDDAGEEDRLSF